jgi:hypothetical protein
MLHRLYSSGYTFINFNLYEGLSYVMSHRYLIPGPAVVLQSYICKSYE